MELTGNWDRGALRKVCHHGSRLSSPPPFPPVTTDDGLFVEATNSVAKKWFRGIDELLCADQPKHRMLPFLLMLAYVPPPASIVASTPPPPRPSLSHLSVTHPDTRDMRLSLHTAWWPRRTGRTSAT